MQKATKVKILKHKNNNNKHNKKHKQIAKYKNTIIQQKSSENIKYQKSTSIKSKTKIQKKNKNISNN